MAKRDYQAGFILTGDASGGIRAIQKTGKELKTLDEGFGRSSRQSKKFGADAARAGHQLREIDTGAGVATKGLETLRRAAAPIAGALASMFAANTIQNQIDWGDQLQKTNLRIGASTESLSQYNYVAKLSGFEFGQLTTAWQRQTRRIAEAAAGTGVASEALDRLGLSAQALNQLAPEEQFERIAEAMQNVESSSERVALAQKLWDSEGVKLVQIVNQGTDAIAAMRAEADALGLTITQDTANAMATYNDEVDRLKFAAQGLSQTVAAELVPSMTAGLQATNSFIQEAGGASRILNEVKDVATLTAVVMAGRYAGSLAESTKRMIERNAASRASAAADKRSLQMTLRRAAAEKQTALMLLSSARLDEQAARGTDAHTAALARLRLARERSIAATASHTVAQNAHNAAMARGTIAAQAMAGATRAGSAALSLVGGTMGAAVIAGAAVYYFRDSLGFASAAARETKEDIDQLVESMDNYTEAQYRNNRVSIVQDLAEARVEAAKLQDQIEALQEQSQQENVMYQGRPGASSGQLSGLMAELQEQNRVIAANEEGLRKYDQAWSDLLESQVSGVSIFRTLDQWLFDTGESAGGASTQFDALNYTLGTGGEDWDDYIGKLQAARDVMGMTAAEAAQYAAMQQGYTGVYAEHAGAVVGQTNALNDYRQAIAAGNAEEAQAHLQRAQRYAEAEAMVKAQLQNAATLSNLMKGVQTQLSTVALTAALTIADSGAATSSHIAEAIRLINERAEAIKQTTVVTVANTAATREAAKETTTLANSYENLLDRIQPNRRAARQYAQDVGVLNLALATGRMNTVQYMQAMGLLQESFQAAQRETDKTAQASEDASQRIANSFTTWGTVADNTLRSVDDTGRDAWLGLVDGSTSALDTVERAFEQTFANIAHMLTTQKLTFEVAGMMGLDTTGMPGGGSGGFDVGSMGSLKNGWGALQSGVSNIAWTGAPTAYSGGFAGNATAGMNVASQGTSYLGGSTANFSGMTGLASAGAGFAGSYAGRSMFGEGRNNATLETAGALVGTYFGGPLGAAAGSFIGSALASLDKETKFSGRFGTTGTNDPSEYASSGKDGVFEHQDDGTNFYGQSALGYTGFLDRGTERLQRAGMGEDKGWAEELTAEAVARDNLVASLATTTAEIEGMQSVVQGLEASSSNAGELIEFALNERPRAALEALEGHFGEFVRGLGGGIEEVVQQAQVARQAHSVLATGMERLNLQFDSTAEGAYASASSIAEWAGGVDQLASLQDSYYQNYFAESERAAHLQADLTESLAAMGLELPDNEAGFRALVEAQNQNTEAGGRNYVQLLQLSSGFSQLQGMLGDTSAAADGAADSMASVEAAMRERESIDTEWLRMIGDTAELRRRELAELDPSNRALQQRNWLFEDEQKWLSEIEQRQQQRISGIKQEADAMARAKSELAGFGNSIDSWIAQFDATEQGMGTPRERLEASGGDFWAQYEKALAGDRNARQSITQFADRAIDNLQEFYASSDPGVNGVNEIRDAMEQLPELLTPEQFLADEFRGVIEDQTVTLSDVLDLNADGTVSAIERAIAAEWNATQQLNNVLHHEMTQLGATVLTESEVRAALGPHATDAEISRLIARVDVNGDGMITRQELTNARIDSLGGGIATSIAPLFDQIDIDGSGWIDYSEFNKTFEGMATDSTLNEIFGLIDTNGDGQLSQLEAIAASSSTLVDLWASQQPGDVQSAISQISGMYENALGRAPDLPGIQYWIDEFLAGASLKTISDSINQHVGRDPGANSGGGSTGGSTGGGSMSAVDAWLSSQTSQVQQWGNQLQGIYQDSHSRSATVADLEYWTGQLSDGKSMGTANDFIRGAAYINRYADVRNAWNTEKERWQRQSGAANATEFGIWHAKNLGIAEGRKFANGGMFAGGDELGRPATNSIVSRSTFFNIGEMGEEDPEAIMPLSRGAGGRLGIDASGLMRLPDGPMQLPMPEMPPLPQFPALGNNDVLQVLNDVRKELQETRKENKRLLELIGENTGDTVDAIEEAAARSERQRDDQLDELETISRHSKTEIRTT
ncbi:EF-hand domain-containing protein [Halomonas campaniensis]|uniref:EF-hand domain-containing protein n=1 Tax=Halomonas campaniensis TaxID=213554 RepID=A0A246RZ44_9GAMM|nr:EF-hand domain-containing protein [Halomonas campaniensis]OWV29442.1 hypothetical protein JI62_11540 [Halomonas campaniensis]